jgi:hypothetical protein
VFTGEELFDGKPYDKEFLMRYRAQQTEQIRAAAEHNDTGQA